MTSWETFDQKQALSEGWCLILRSGDGRVELQRDDAQRLFAFDEDAVAFVTERSEEGSTYHHDALAIVATQAVYAE